MSLYTPLRYFLIVSYILSELIKICQIKTLEIWELVENPQLQYDNH